MYKKLKQLQVTNYLTSTLKVDKETPGDPFIPLRNHFQAQPRQVREHFSYVEPQIQQNTKILSYNTQLSLELGLGDVDLEDPEYVDVLSGSKPFPGSNPWALCYGGHQFGSWAGQLGDGRAISIAQINVNGSLKELQLKGAGMTPYSRFADGYAVVRSSIREYLCAEAMAALKIPTSRSLALIKTEITERGAIVCRVAESWIRFGSFEILFSRNDLEGLQQLADYCIDRHFIHLKSNTQKYSLFFQDVVTKTAEMIAHWQASGFCHGVMNTDNFSILGLTIDYGPFQFLDTYDPNYICNHSDEGGRYSFINQPKIALWNLVRLANALSDLVKLETGDKKNIEKLQEILGNYFPTFQAKYSQLMCQKFGFAQGSNELMKNIVEPCLLLLQSAQIDYSRFFRSLSTQRHVTEQLSCDHLKEWQSLSNLASSAFDELAKGSTNDHSLSARFSLWYIAYNNALSTQNIELDKVKLQMLSINPKYILRNNLAQMVIEKTDLGESEWVDRYLRLLQNPFDEGTESDTLIFAGLVPKKSQGIKCSCSS